MEWIPRAENGLAEYYSRTEDYDDWGISFHLWNLIQNRFGTISIDWFASDHNAKVKRYFVPPITLITRVWRKMINDRAIGFLVIPCWRSAAFWPILCLDGRIVPSVVDWFDLPINKEFYTRCKNGNGMFGNTDLKFRMLALNLKFR